MKMAKDFFTIFVNDPYITYKYYDVPNIVKKLDDIYDYKKYLPTTSIDCDNNLNVTIIGCGGVGYMVAIALSYLYARKDKLKVIVIDPDTWEYHNIPRLLPIDYTYFEDKCDYILLNEFINTYTTEHKAYSIKNILSCKGIKTLAFISEFFEVYEKYNSVIHDADLVLSCASTYVDKYLLETVPKDHHKKIYTISSDGWDIYIRHITEANTEITVDFYERKINLEKFFMGVFDIYDFFEKNIPKLSTTDSSKDNIWKLCTNTMVMRVKEHQDFDVNFMYADTNFAFNAISTMVKKFNIQNDLLEYFKKKYSIDTKPMDIDKKYIFDSDLDMCDCLSDLYTGIDRFIKL